MSIKPGSNIAVWFSCGAASAVAAKKTIQLYGDQNFIRVLNNPVAEEDLDNRRFLRDVQAWLGIPIEIVTAKKYPEGSAVKVWEDKRYMSGTIGAPCTVELKKRARQEWEKTNAVDWHVLGFTYEEKHRHERFIMTERDNLIPVLIDQKITKADCYNILRAADIRLPRIYELGYPNANCIGCVKATSSTYWNHVRSVHPQVFQERAEQSRRLGARLVRYKGKRMFLDELPLTAFGKSMKNLDFECGLFCEEKP